MSNELAMKARLEPVNVDHHLDDIPNDENILFDGKNKLLINETKEFIPKSYYESKSDSRNNELKKGEIENFIKYEEEALNRIQTFNYDKLSETNRIDVKMMDRPLLDQEEMHFKKSNMSFIFETENSLKGDNINSKNKINSSNDLNGNREKNGSHNLNEKLSQIKEEDIILIEKDKDDLFSKTFNFRIHLFFCLSVCLFLSMLS